MLSPGLYTCISVWSLNAGRPQLWCPSYISHTSTSHMSSWMTKVSSCCAALCSHALVVSHSYTTVCCYYSIGVTLHCLMAWCCFSAFVRFAFWPYIDIPEQHTHNTYVHPSLLITAGCCFSALALAIMMKAFGSFCIWLHASTWSITCSHMMFPQCCLTDKATRGVADGLATQQGSTTSTTMPCLSIWLRSTSLSWIAHSASHICPLVRYDWLHGPRLQGLG